MRDASPTSRSPARRAPSRAAALLVASLLAVAAPAAGQEAEPTAGREAVPLSRSDLTRMLAGSTYTPDEVVRMIRRSCLGFRPTGGDLRRFRELGATDDVVSALDGCSEDAPGERLRLGLPDSVTARAGDTAVVRGRVERGGRGVPGVPVVLEVAGGASPAAERLVAATSEAGGRIAFRIPVGRRPGRRVLRPRAAAVALADLPRVELVVRPGPVHRVDVRPEELILEPDGPTHLTVEIRLRDAYGNGLSGEGVVLDPEDPPAGPPLVGGVTDAAGRVRFSVARSRLRGAGRIGVRAGDTVVTWISVREAVPGGVARGPGGR